MKTPTRMRPLTAAGLTLASTLCFAQAGGPPPVNSPEIVPDGVVTFRLRAPEADTVELASSGAVRLGPADNDIEAFAAEFAVDVKPYVETHYRVGGGRSSTAIAGLSMGGAHTLEIVMGALDEYGYVGVFSSGILGDEDSSWRARHAAVLDDASLRRGLELVWFSTGSDDFLLENTERTVALLRDHGFDVVYRESTGGHTWINWREYLYTFAAELFD